MDTEAEILNAWRRRRECTVTWAHSWLRTLHQIRELPET